MSHVMITKRGLFFLLILCFFVCDFLFAQQTTVNFTTPFISYDMCKRGDNIFLASQGGVLKLNTANGQKEFYTAANTPIFYNETKAVCVDKAGNYWFGNMGVVKYDGNQWTRYYDLPSGDTIKAVDRIIEGTGGKIYIHDSQSRCVFIFDGATITVIKASQFSAQNFYDFDVDTLGNIWFADGGRLIQYDGITPVYYDSASIGFAGNKIFGVRADKKGLLWVRVVNDFTNASFFYKKNGNVWTQITGGAVSTATQYKLYIGEDDNKYFNHYDTVYKYNDTTWSVFSYNGGQLAGTTVTHVYADSSGNFYTFSVYGDTIRKYDGSSATDYDAGGYNFDCNYFRDIFKGDDDLIYACNMYGIVVTNGINFQTIQRPTTDYFRWIKKDNFGNIWALTDDSTPYLSKFSNGTWTVYNLSAYGSYATSLGITPNGTVYVGFNDGFVKYNGLIFTKYILNDPYSPFNPRTVFNMAADSNSNIWINDGYSLVKFDGANFTYYSNYPTITLQNLGGIFCDKSGNIWTNIVTNSVTYTYGLIKFDGTNYTFFTDTNSNLPPDAPAFTFYEDDSGKIYMGTINRMIIYDGTQFNVYSFLDYGFGGYYVFGIAKDNNKNIWYTGGNDWGIFNPNGITNIEIEPKNSVNGNVFFDANQNGNNDSADAGLPNQLLMMEPDSMYRFTNGNGDYNFFSDTGNVIISRVSQSNWNLTTDSLNFSVYVDTLVECCYDFGIYPDSIFTSAEFTITTSAPRCHQVIPAWIDFYNTGTLPLNATVYYVVDSLTGFEGSWPDTSYSSGDTLFWSFSQVFPFDLKQVLFSLQMPNDSSVGALLVFTAGILDSATSQLLDSAQLTDTLLCAVDPNDKIVFPAGITSNHYTLFSDTLVYTIRFQNTGNDTAFTVAIYDTLSAALDMTTFKFIASSHPFDVQYDSKGRVRFRAENIMLPDSGTNQLQSQGFVKYSINAKSGLPDPTLVTNTAYIYFDYNFPITTNTAFNTLVSQLNVSVSSNQIQKGLTVFPNPTSSKINFKLSETTSSACELKLFDLHGRLLLRKIFSDNLLTIDVNEFGSGMFFYSVEENNQMYRGKIMVVKK